MQPFETEQATAFVLDTIRREVHLLGKPLADAVARFRAADAQVNLVPARYAEWLEALAAEAATGHGLTPRTLGECRRFEKEIAARFAGVSVREVDAGALDAWSTALAARGLSPKTRKNMVSALRSFLGWSQVRGLIVTVPPTPKIRQRGGKTKLPRLSVEEQASVLLQIEEAERGAFLAMALLGLRAGEARAVQVEDVDLGRGVLTVRWAMKGLSAYAERGETKTGTERPLPLPALLAEWCGKHLPSSGHAFVNPRTRKAFGHYTLWETWTRAAKAAGIPDERIHLQANTRHSAATAAVGRGEQLALVSALLGHSNLETARRHYIEVAPETLRRLIQ